MRDKCGRMQLTTSPQNFTTKFFKGEANCGQMQPKTFGVWKTFVQIAAAKVLRFEATCGLMRQQIASEQICLCTSSAAFPEDDQMDPWYPYAYPRFCVEQLRRLE